MASSTRFAFAKNSQRSRAGKGLLVRSRGVWTVLASGVPIALSGLALAGYDYTARRFEDRLALSWLFALGLILVNAMLLRWLFIARRRLAVAQALEAKARREEEEDSELGAGEGTALVALDGDKVDIPAVDARTRQLFKSGISLASLVGLFFIWSGVFPALHFARHGFHGGGTGNRGGKKEGKKQGAVFQTNHRLV